MNRWMFLLFGASWRTALAGWAESFLLVLAQHFHDAGGVLPTSQEGWFLWILAALRAWFATVAKDARVSNAPVPADPKPVPNAGHTT